MVSELRFKKEAKDHIEIDSMTRVIKKGFKLLGNLTISIKNFLLKIISKLSKEVVHGNLFSNLSDTFKDENVWVIDSGASRHTMRECSRIQTWSKGISSHSIELRDKKRYLVKGIGSTSLELKSSGSIHLNNILYVLGSKKQWLSSISCLEDKGDRVTFVDGKVLVLGKDSSINETRVIGVQEGTLYKLYIAIAQALVHLEVSPFELWHNRYEHLHFKILPSLSKMFNRIPKIKEDHEGTCRGCALGKDVKKPFSSSKNRSREILDIILLGPYNTSVVPLIVIVSVALLLFCPYSPHIVIVVPHRSPLFLFLCPYIIVM